MLKEFIEHIQNTTQPQIRVVEGATFAITADGVAKEILPTIFHPDPLPLNSLDAMVKLVRTEASNMDTPLYITMPDHMTVRCFGQPDVAARYFRQVYYEAMATDVPGWSEKVTLGFEEAQIALRTRFQETQDTLYAMKLVSDISLGAKVIFNDNGIATTITTQKGVALQTNEQIRPLVKLRPYRTFQEVEQPESIFLIRISERGIAFIEADGGMWKLKAREVVKAHLEDKLSAEVEGGSVIIAL
ncbi:hypothetical protein [Intestinimonas butyriciproducens]|uniref:Uncharacterized protein n=1 Tax=Intestinimonas butyriciproducens TaxID=1297617 RepID=A0A2U1BEH8_9FIRM|nr:hypothetical protein [Intestinimonas butyriciproducens]MCR1905159.1 hypothetical protein [Intestinimonas butyriciproducens]PVY47036.1 hypothetical protein C7373_11139 [Intestinimonas butyriciproducens]QBB65780.1 Phage-related protein [Intestinimonas butyriciproducens]